MQCRSLNRSGIAFGRIGYLQLRTGGLLVGHGDLQIAVPAADGVDQALLQPGLPEGDPVSQAEHTAHIGGLDTDQLVGSGVGLNQIIEDAGVIQILGDGDIEGPMDALGGSAQIGVVAEQEHGAQHHGEDQCIEHLAHARSQTCAHGQEEHTQFPGIAGQGAETDEAEGACHSKASADVMVDDHNDGADRRRYHDQCRKRYTIFQQVSK